MKKILFLIMVAVSLWLNGNAQTSQIATLLHEDEIKNFTSATAFAQALDAAVDGDIITLSSGMFQGVNITKNVTIRGAGMGYPEYGGAPVPTVINGNISIDCPESENYSLSLEGISFLGTIYHTRADGLSAQKCQFNDTFYGNSANSEWNDLKFIHCIFSKVTPASKTSAQFVNCVISDEINLSGMSNSKSCQFENCVVVCGASISYQSLTNCIIYMVKGSAYQTQINKDCNISHCIVAHCQRGEYYDDNNMSYNENKDKIFAENGLFELVEELKGFKGTDGGQIGIHGGALPFSPMTSNLKISKFKVAEKTTADGKLPIEIEIEAN